MKITLVNLKDSYHKREYSVDMLGMLSLATIISQESSYNVEIIDFQHEFSVNEYVAKQSFMEELQQQFDRVMSTQPNLVCFYTMCSNYHLSIALAKKIKEESQETKIIFGGPQATLTAEETMKVIPWIDGVGIGEGETSILPIIEAVLTDNYSDKVKGLVYRQGNEIINTGMPDLINNLDDLPFIDYSFINMKMMKKVDIDAGRGCPFGCTFCSTKSFWNRKFRLKSPERIVREIQMLKEDYGINHFSLTHDLFTANKKKVMQFCKLLDENNLDITWGCSSRADTLDEEMIKVMSASGCERIFLGVESGSPRMQKIINKNLKLEKLLDTVRNLKLNNIEFVLSFIYGFPEETVEDVNMTLELIDKLFRASLINFNSVQLHELSYFPGTELLQRYGKELKASQHTNATMFNETKIPEYLSSIIHNNPTIFPHLLERPSELKKVTASLDKYMILIYLRTIKKFRFTFEIILRHYNYNYIQLFQDYKKAEGATLNSISFYHEESIRNIIIESIYSMKRFIDSQDFGKLNYIIKNIAKFEFDITTFLFLSETEMKEIEYPIDVYKAVNENRITEIEEKIRVKFTRTGDKNISVNKVNLCLEG